VLIVHAQSKQELNKQSKNYNGLYILNDQLHQIFTVADISYTIKPIATTLLNQNNYLKTGCIFLARTFLPTTKDLIALKDFVKQGNFVFILASDFSENVNDILEIETDYSIDITYRNTLKLVKSETNFNDTVGSKAYKNVLVEFTKYDTSRTEILGVNTNGKPNFIKCTYGQGAIFIHLYPDVTMNYFLVEKNNYNYTEALLSYMPKNLNKLIITVPKRNSTYNGDDNNEDGFFSFIKNNPNLFAAFLIGLGIFALLLLFGFKKRQRTIPILKPVQNTTLEFATTIGDLYFNKKNNADIANKKIIYWKEYVRNKYQIPTHTLQGEFWEKLAKKTAADTALLKDLERNIVAVNSQANVSDRLLIQLSNNIDHFNKI
jgi:hypothetical protein